MKVKCSWIIRQEVIVISCVAATAKSLQSCQTLCDPIDSSPPGSPFPGILQARTLEWVAISFSNAWKGKGKVKLLSPVRLLATPWTAAYQAPPSMGFSRQEYWSSSSSIGSDSYLLSNYSWTFKLQLQPFFRYMKESPAGDKRVKELHIVFCEFELSRGKWFLGVSAFAMWSHGMRHSPRFPFPAEWAETSPEQILTAVWSRLCGAPFPPSSCPLVQGQIMGYKHLVLQGSWFCPQLLNYLCIQPKYWR